ncbi:MAG: adenosylcobinamide-GDP ribazoletransferase [Leptothrix sp. (in: Bacteria)]|nr:adenosylcobinamide-GDP ribazoletransferase [Leptothrix sp. (in: b-proteobacteria)]
MLHELRLLAVATQFLTRWPVRLPAGATATWDERWLTDCVRHFPAVGALLGAAVGLVLWAASLLWPPAIAAVLAVALGTWWTGAFHEDGLADTFDALGGNVRRERALVIMKDSRIGSYGAMALVLVTGARIAALAAVVAVPQASPSQGLVHAVAACVWTHALARWVSVAVMAGMPYAGDEEHAKAKPLARGVPYGQTLAAGLWLMPLLVMSGTTVDGGLPVLAITLLAAGLVALGLRRWLRRRLGGYTGDTLGAAEQLAETVILLAWVAVMGVSR